VESALALADEQKMELIERLLATLGPETDGIDEAGFTAELNRRSDEIDQGTAEVVPWAELRDEKW
jgi:putative addiction module component (TIGR02574 family)